MPCSSPSSSSSSSSSPSSPSISQWLPLSPLGSGSFGHVSLALNLADGSLFAVKSSPSPSPSSLLSLHNELHLLQSLHSPSIIHCLGSDLPSQNSIFLEYMDGGSLAAVLKQSGGKLHDEKLIAHYTRAILQGLDYLHRNGVVHCDIKSHNILIGSTGIKIADFGAARRLGEAPPLDGTLRGTPLWMAPEVIKGEEQGTSSDIWSLGCTVVEMMQGRPPWGHISNLEALLFKVGSSEDNPPLPEAISAEAKDFLLNCLQRDPKKRRTAEELLQHPFLSNWEEEAHQLSPRSTLDFVHSTESESDWEHESMEASGPILLCSRPPLLAESIKEEGGWITVRRAERWCERKPLIPFIEQAAAAGEALQVRRACEVSLDCAAFLKRRRTIAG